MKSAIIVQGSVERCRRFAAAIGADVTKVIPARELFETIKKEGSPDFLIAGSAADLFNIAESSVAAWGRLVHLKSFYRTEVMTLDDGGTSLTLAGTHGLARLFAEASTWANLVDMAIPTSFVGVMAHRSKVQRQHQRKQLKMFAAVEDIEFSEVLGINEDLRPSHLKALWGSVVPGQALILPEMIILGAEPLVFAHTFWNEAEERGIHLGSQGDRLFSWHQGCLNAWIARATLPLLPSDFSVDLDLIENLRVWANLGSITEASRALGMRRVTLTHRLEKLSDILKERIDSGATPSMLEGSMALPANSVVDLLSWMRRVRAQKRRKTKTFESKR